MGRRAYMVRFLFATIAVIALILQGESCLADDLSSLISAMNQSEPVRVIVGQGGGTGHQSAALVTVRRLRQLGYKGKIDVVISEIYENKISPEHPAPKFFESLIPGFNSNGPDSQELDGSLGKLRVLSDPAFLEGTQPTAKFAIAVGISWGRHEYYDGLAGKYKSDYVLKFGPAGYGEYGPNFAVTASDDAKPFGSQMESPQIFADPLYLASLSEPEKFPDKFIDQSFHEFPGYGEKASGFKTLFHMRSSANLLPSYGLGFGGPPKLARLIAALASQEFRSSPSGKKPTIIPLISHFNEKESAEFRALLAQVQTKGLIKKPFSILEITDPELQSKLAGLPADATVLVNTGRLPQPIAEMLFDQSELPPLISGASMGSFMESRGRPYLDTASEQTGRHTEMKRPGAEHFIEPSVALQGDPNNSDALSVDSIRKIAEFYRDAGSPTSAVRDYFRKFKDETPAHDEIIEMLSDFQTFIGKHEPALCLTKAVRGNLIQQ